MALKPRNVFVVKRKRAMSTIMIVFSKVAAESVKTVAAYTM
jgi:hypothetical protein